MDDVINWIWIELGVVFSLALPWALAVFLGPSATGKGAGDAAPEPWYKLYAHRAWEFAKPYGKYLIASAIISVVVLAGANASGAQFDKWWKWFLLGIGWDTVIAKFVREKPLGWVSHPPPAA
jgi:hypothetical protein